jgi:hypothetical protein
VWEGLPEPQALSENAIFGSMTPMAEFSVHWPAPSNQETSIFSKNLAAGAHCYPQVYPRFLWITIRLCTGHATISLQFCNARRFPVNETPVTSVAGLAGDGPLYWSLVSYGVLAEKRSATEFSRI